MGYYTTAEIVKIVNKLIDRCGTRDPYKVAKELGINIIYRNFDKQRGAYKVILKNRFVFLKNGIDMELFFSHSRFLHSLNFALITETSASTSE